MKKFKEKVLIILIILMAVLFINIGIINAEDKVTMYFAKTYIDYPVNNKVGANIVVEGWIMTNDEQAKVEAYIDGNKVDILSENRTERIDVLNAIKGYGTEEQNKLPGMKLILDSKNITEGNHNLNLIVISRENNVIAEHSSNFQYENEKAQMYIDTLFDSTISNNYKIEGWVMSNDANAKLKIYIDEEEQNLSNLIRVKRNDVIKAISGYGTEVENPLPGFEYYIDCQNIIDGSHVLKIDVVSEEGVSLAKYTKFIKVEKYKAKAYIDYPTQNEIYGDLDFEGWIMTNDENAIYKLYIDDEEQKDIEFERIERPDVLKSIEGYGTEEENKFPGIKYKINTENMQLGKHSITLAIYSREGCILEKKTSHFILEDAKAKMDIDEPLYNNQEVSSELKIRGWLMSNDKYADIRVNLDGQEQTIKKLERKERQDVLEAIKAYGTEKENPLPGFEFYVDCKNLEDGSYVLNIEAVSKEGKLLAQHTKNILVRKYKAKTYIDYPENNAMSGDFEFEGWIMTNDEMSTYKLYIDEEEQKDIEFERIERPDVLKSIEGYGTEEENKLPGIKCEIDTENMELGEHSVTLDIYSREGCILERKTSVFILENAKAKMDIDEPLYDDQEVSSELKIRGWLMSNDKYANIRVYIDGQEQTLNNLERKERQDVLEAIKGYGTEKENPLPGFETYIDLSNFSNGEHVLKIDVVTGSGETINSHEKIIFLDKYMTNISIDSPVKNQVVKTTLQVDGWIMSSGQNPEIKLFVDDKEIDSTRITRKERNDVIEKIKGYGTEKENPLPGFELQIDTSRLLEGKHTLKVLAILEGKETRKIQTVDFIVNKYNTRICIDEPVQSSTREETLKIRGWAMSELANKKIIVKIDDNVIDNITYNERPDVISAVKDYGGITENPTPGFETTIDIRSYSKDVHTIKIQVYSNETNEILQEVHQNIVFLEKIKREVITYGYSGAYLRGVSGGSELICYKYGDGPNVLFATFCVHGYEDSWARDGEALVNIANKFYDRLIADQDYALSEKWTIYIFPEVNPDGRRLGTTNNGPGRTTIYSEVGKGIDINRSWQTGSTYETFSSNRNYNGTAGFQAYEARYLRDFMLTHKTNIGQNVVVDLHGWQDQLIGDESVCKYYKEQYTSCRTTGYGRYGSQYLISWARLNLGAKVALVELPLAQNNAQVESMQLANKYINATLNLLKGI